MTSNKGDAWSKRLVLLSDGTIESTDTESAEEAARISEADTVAKVPVVPSATVDTKKVKYKQVFK